MRKTNENYDAEKELLAEALSFLVVLFFLVVFVGVYYIAYNLL